MLHPWKMSPRYTILILCTSFEEEVDGMGVGPEAGLEHTVFVHNDNL
jgi:hypothetical protein